MISYPAPLKAVGGARTGVAPANLLDIQDVNGNYYFLSDRKILAPPAMGISVPGTTQPWISNGAQNAAYPLPISDGTAPVVVPVTGAAVSIIATGTVNYGGVGLNFGPKGNPATAGEMAAGLYTLPNNFIGNAALGIGGLCGAFCDAEGNVIEPIAIGTGGSFAIPAGAVQLQLGINDTVWHDDTGFFRVVVIVAGSAIFSSELQAYEPWLLSVPSFSFYRSLQTDTGGFVLQNLSGDTLSRDLEKIVRSSVLEGAFFVYRLWQADAEASWIEVHGTFTVNPLGVDTGQFKGSQLLNPSQDDTPLENYCETCQLQWGGKRCGSTQADECSYSFQTCQVVERIMVAMNDYEKNFGETTANTALNVINRRRKI